ncbi:MAG: TolC family protein [Planctomycetes bacterium]|nr:TolC family protein [Planctomycetota bacterium]MCG2684211.1 TolC family protein [Planctomycetales bacterium]
MSRQPPLICVVMAAFCVVLTGCQPQQPFYLKNVDNDYLHYKGVATEIEYPDVETERLADAENAQAPFSLQRKDNREIWDLTLEEAMRISLMNNKVMRNISGQVQGPPDFIARNPELAPTIYDPAIAESNPRTGPEAALSAFDAQVSASLTWEKLDTPQNVDPAYAFIFPNVARDDLGTFQAKVSKIAASGGQFSLGHNVAYDLSNRPSRAWPSDWNVNLAAEVRQPLLQGAGTQFNRIAGPGATPGNYNGVMIARINTDIALADFEAAVRNLVSDVEVAYWELYFQYRSLDAVIAGRDSALQTWRKIYTLYTHGARGGEAEKEAQAREQYFLFRSTAEQSLNNLYSTEAKLRYMLGLAATDGRLIRPKDEPTTAKVVFDWHEVLSEGLVRSVELREQKWIVKRRELELIAAKNFLLPRVDFVGQYRWLGMGNRIDGNSFWNPNSLVIQDANAYGTLANGGFQEWQAGFQASMPLGFRREMAGVRNSQLSLARERARLQEAELELSHQLAYAIRDLEANHVLSQTNFNRRIAAQRQVEAVAAAYETDTITLDVLLKAQQALAQAESDYFRSLVNFNKSIAQVHYRKGSLLEYNGVYLAEGPWPGKAYFDARRRSRARAASTYLDYGFTQPRVISRGPIEQHTGIGGLLEEGVLEPTPATNEPELVPTPAPEPIPADAVPAEPAPAAPEPVAESRASVFGGQWKAVAGRSPASRPTDRQIIPTAGWTAVERVRR